MGDRSGAYRVFVGKHEEKVLLGRPRRRVEDNIKMGFQDVGWGRELDWSGSGYREVAGSS